MNEADVRPDETLGSWLDGVGEPISPELALVDPELAARARELLSLEPVGDCLAPRPRPAEPDAVMPVAAPTLERGVPWRVLAGAAVLVVVAGVFSVPAWLLPFRGGGHPGVTLEQLTRAPAPVPRPAPAVRLSLPRSVHGTANVQAPGKAPKQQQRRAVPRPAAPRVTTPAAPRVTTPARTPPAPARRPNPAAPASPKPHATTPAAPVKPKPPATTPAAPVKPKPQASSPAAPAGPKPQATTPAAPTLPPLGWAPVAAAVGYHVELVQGARRVYAATTSRAQLALPSRWSYQGRSYRLAAGRYRWYVWPLFRRGGAQTPTRGRPIVAATLTVPG
jgi:hypothetical protein